MEIPQAKTTTDPLEAFKEESGQLNTNGTTGNMMKFIEWFQDSVSYVQAWRLKARESFEFVEGKQWTDGDIAKMRSEGRPAITINKIKPLINILSGYQRTNRYDIDFLPRTNDDAKLCDVRKAMTKYVMDRSSYDMQESEVFVNGCICGFGWFEVGYKFDEGADGEGEAFIKSESPFNIYIDPEAKEMDYSDCKYIIRAHWVNKDEIIAIYPEHKDEIIGKTTEYDQNENDDANNADLFYQRDKKKIRICECWYKVRVTQTTYLMNDGSMITLTNDDLLQMTYDERMMFDLNAINKIEDTINQVRVCTFFDSVKLEDIESPYQHGEFPFVPFVAYHYDENELPKGVVESAKDVQRDINKRRSEYLHIINTSSHSGWLYQREAMDSVQKHNFAKNASKAGALLEVKDMNKIRELVPPNPPMSILQAINDAANDMREVTGINETLMGTDIPNSASGRAIELKQKQAITHLMPLFDALRLAKKKIAYLLWGKRRHAGIIPQFYTEEKVYRIEGQNGAYSFMTINQKKQVQTNDPLMPVITQTLNDLSQGEFDIVIADVSASATQREAQFWALSDAISKLGIPGDMVFDLLLDLSNVPNKDDIKLRFQQRQQQQAQAQQAQAQQQLQLIQAQNNRTNKSINIKDVPLPVQLAMLAKENLVDPNLAKYMMEIYVRTIAPNVAQQEAIQNRLVAQQQARAGTQQQITNEQLQDLQRRIAAQQALAGSTAQNNNQRTPSNSRMTQSAANSLRSGQMPSI